MNAHRDDLTRIATSYLRDEVQREWQDQETFGGFDKVIGFGQCAYVREVETEIEYHFPLRVGCEPEVCFTLNQSFGILSMLGDEKDKEGHTNREQLFELSTRCDREAIGWGHMIGGYVHPSMRRWLSQLAAQKRDDPFSKAREAMCLTYETLDPEHAELVMYMCNARLHSTGRFILECPGNACDVAIYPESDWRSEEDDTPVYIGCHNLDGSRQQLTLLVGLAVLHELAEADLG